MKKSIGRTLAHIDVAANTSVRIHEDFFNSHSSSHHLSQTEIDGDNPVPDIYPEVGDFPIGESIASPAGRRLDTLLNRCSGRVRIPVLIDALMRITVPQ
jgi:hypothetical protein